MAKAVGPEHPQTQLFARNTVFVPPQLQRFEAADAIMVRYFGQDSPQRASGLATRAFALYKAGDFETAAPLWLEAIRISATARPSDDTELAIWRQNLAKLRYNQGDYTAAEALYREAWAVLSDMPDDKQGRMPANFARLLRDAPPSPERSAMLTELQARFGENVGTTDYQP